MKHFKISLVIIAFATGIIYSESLYSGGKTVNTYVSILYVLLYIFSFFLLAALHTKKLLPLNKFLIICILLAFPTLKPEKDHQLMYMGDGNYEETGQLKSKPGQMAVDQYYRVAPLLISFNGLFVNKTCNHVYTEGFKRGQLYCINTYTLDKFDHLSRQFILHIGAVLASVILSVILYAATMRKIYYPQSRR